MLKSVFYFVSQVLKKLFSSIGGGASSSSNECNNDKERDLSFLKEFDLTLEFGPCIGDIYPDLYLLTLLLCDVPGEFVVKWYTAVLNP